MSTTHDLLSLAESWANAADSSLQLWLPHTTSVDLLQMNGKDARYMACALDLCSALASRPDFGQALHDLGLEPIAQNSKCPRG